MNNPMDVIQAARAASLRDHHLAILKSRRATFEASLPRAVIGARLGAFQARNPGEAKVRDAAMAWLEACKAGGNDNLSLVGPPGVGKTWLMAAIGQALLHTDRPAVYLRAPAAWAQVRSSYDSKGRDGEASERTLMGFWINCPVLLLDEIGAGHITEPYRACMAEIIGQRTDDGRPTVCASNLAPKLWASALDERAADRMAGGVTLALLGASRRGSV